MKKLLLTALLFFCAACYIFARNSPPPAIFSLPMVVSTTTSAPPDTSNPILTSIVLSTTPPPAHQPSPGAVSPGHPSPSVPPRPVTLRVQLRDLTLKPSGLILEWELQVNGMFRQKGAVPNMAFSPQHTALVHLPVRPPTDEGDEAFLQVRYRSRQPAASRKPTLPPSAAQPGPVIVEE